MRRSTTRPAVMRVGQILLALVFVAAGALKLVHHESLGVLRILGSDAADPSWLPMFVGAFELLVGGLLLFRPRQGLPLALVFSVVFCAYHIALGLGTSAPT